MTAPTSDMNDVERLGFLRVRDRLGMGDGSDEERQELLDLEAIVEQRKSFARSGTIGEPTADQLAESRARATPRDDSIDQPERPPRPVGPFEPSPLHSPGYARGYAAYVHGDCEPPDVDDETFAADWNTGMDAAIRHPVFEAPDEGPRPVRLAGAVGLAIVVALTALALWVVS